MRDILFRGKRSDYGGWVEGCLVIDESRQNTFGYRIQPTESGNSFAYPVTPETISQYTGIYDANGKRVFENDLFKIYNVYVPVRYGCYQSSFESKVTKHVGFYVEWPEEIYFRRDIGYWIRRGFTVVGNVFDNPELLQEVPE